MENLKVAILQADLAWENPEKNIDYFTKEIMLLPETVDLIVLPEMFTTGFSMNAEPLAETNKGKSLSWMQEMAKTKNACITGSLIIENDGKYYNRLYWVFPDYTYQSYDKKHLFTLAKEEKTYSAGDQKLIVHYKGWKFCPLICYDLRFPVWARNTEDYDVLLYVANWPKMRTAAWDALLKARAIENMAYCVGVNRVGKDGNDYPYVGHSAVYDALGNLLTKSDYHEKAFTELHELNYNELQKVRNKLGFLKDRDTFQFK